MTALPFFLCRFPLSPRPVETSATQRYQLTHVLDTQSALQGHQFSDVFVDAFPPESLLRRRRASTFCKPPFKNPPPSTSRRATALAEGFPFDGLRHVYSGALLLRQVQLPQA